MERAREPKDLELSPLESIVVSVSALLFAGVGRALDLLLLLARPSLIRPYLAIWLAEVQRSPYRWPRSFEAVRVLKASGQTVRELMYGETPLCTAVWLFWRGGLRRGGRLVDLGAGRGRALLAARWLGASARGVELLEEHVALVGPSLRRAGAELHAGDAAEADLSGATHVYLNWCAFSDATQRRIASRLLRCPPGTRIVSVTHPAEGQGFRARSTHVGLFTWGLETAFIQELEPTDPQGT